MPPRRHPWSVAFAPAALVAVTVLARPAYALPLFSRQLDASCASCHAAMPALNAAGIEFAQRGYRAIRGDTPTLLSAHGSARDAPLSVIASASLGSASSEVGAGAGPASPARTMRRRSLELRSAGLLAPRLSYGASASYDRDELTGGVAFVQLDDVLADGALNVRAGRFDAELPFLSPVRRATLAAYLTPVSFDARGLELNGERAVWTYAAGVSMSRRDSVGGAAPRALRSPFEDSYVRVSRRLGTHVVGAQMLFDRQNSDLPTLSWVQHLRAELAASLGGPRLAVIPAYVLERFDDRPAAGMHERHQFAMLESTAPIDGGRFALTGRYEHEYRSRNQIDPEQHHQLASLTVAWLPSPYTRFALEWSHAEDRLARRHDQELDAFVQAGW
jgi:hypothetical protein